MSSSSARSETATAIEYLRTPLAIRARCENIFQAARADKLQHFAIDMSKLDAAADRVVEVTKKAYPTLAIPVHGRMNHFRVGGVDRVSELNAVLAALPSPARTRAWIDLIMVSVLLDAGAGDAWRFNEASSGQSIGRSEGLAVASLHAFKAGLFSSDPAQPLRVDAEALKNLDPQRLADAFQVSDKNPLAGRDGRIELVRQLGHAVLASPEIFPGGRPGGLLDYLHDRADGTRLAAPQILAALLRGLGSIWPGRVTLGGVNLGDVWRHPAAGGTGETEGLVPFHKLSQWLSYSLFEPLELDGLVVEQAGALTGLPEYRNGGLFFDMGVLVAKHDGVTRDAHKPGDELIVEWRALTVALLDRIADPVRKKLGKAPEDLPLAKVIEGGTWATGRVLAAELRPGGGSPIQLVSDGTVF